MARRNRLTRFFLPALGACGLFYALYFTLAQANTPEPPDQQLNLPLAAAWDHAVSGSGLIEANTLNLTLGTHVAGIVSEVLVTEGDWVKANEPLFRLDERTVKAELAVREAEVAAAKVGLQDQQDQSRRAQNLTRGVSISTDRIARLNFAVEAAAAALKSATARLEAAQTALSKLTVTAPVEGRIFKINIRVGAFVEANSNQSPIIMGNDRPFHVRVSVDENDLWRLRPELEAKGALRGNRDIGFKLGFVRAEPLVIPKKSLTGSTSERVDTRILELIYRIEDGENKPLFVGQQVDVFIKTDKPS
jgi:HlyD family secretion protein